MAFSAFERQDLVTKVSEILAKAIVEGRLTPGSRLNEVRLAREFDISRAPLREALRRLESQGLIEAHPRRGFFLRSVTAKSISELFEVRNALESTAGLRVARTITDEQIADVEAQYETLRDAASTSNFIKVTEEDYRFHRMICAFSGNERLLGIFDQILSEIRFGLVHVQEFHPDRVSLAEAHVPLISALKARDPELWEQALANHLKEACDNVVAALERKERGLPPEPAKASTSA